MEGREGKRYEPGIRRNGDDEKIREAHGEANKRTGIRVRRVQRDLEKLAWLERLCEK